MRKVGSPDGVGRCLAQPDIADLALAYQRGKGSNGVLDGIFRVDPVDQVKIDDVDLEAPEAALAGDRNIVRRTADADRPVLPVAAGIAELGDDEGLVPTTLDGSGN